MDDLEDENSYSDYDSEFDDLPTETRTILTEKEIKQRLDNEIAALSSALSISRAGAFLLLHHYKWNIEVAQEAWFDDEDGVRKTVGLVNKSVSLDLVDVGGNSVCGVCFEIYVPDVRLVSGGSFCGDSYCSECLAIYISTAINDGSGCLFLRCPDPSCGAPVGEDMVELLGSDEEKKKYRKYLVRSYVEANRKIKWCPAPDCDFAVEYECEGGVNDVSCNCLRGFCWNCNEDAHRPVDCQTVAKWNMKNRSDAENTRWILANSKPCPKCNVPIEKNQGCMHMTCRSCRYQFCWLCLGPWNIHSKETGDYYSCNTYSEDAKKGKYREEDMIREEVKSSLERYTHYYERWHANHKSRERALESLRQVETEMYQKLEARYAQTAQGLKFITQAWLQIVECRGVLKWSYVYAYYNLLEKEKSKREFFEYLQGEAEAALERLHHCVEEEIKIYGDEHNKGDVVKFDTEFRLRLVDLTILTRNYFENFVKGLEK